MVDLDVADILTLAGASSDPSPETRLCQLFSWERDRLVDIGKLLAAFGTALFGTLCAAVWKGEMANFAWYLPLGALGIALAIMGMGLWFVARVRTIRKHYLVAIGRLDWAKVIAKAEAERLAAAEGAPV